jgi:hypothetical protein
VGHKIQILRGEKMKTKKSTHLVWALLMLFLTIIACSETSKRKPTTVPSLALAPTAISSPTAFIKPSPAAHGTSPADLPSQRLDQTEDVDSSSMATAKGVSDGDVFVQGLYERPFNANTMNLYFKYMDIVNIQGFKDDTWGYLEITLAGADKNGHLSAQYAAELDLDKDGRGDWLIRASNPSSTTWTTQGVQTWKDTNGDVGGIVPMAADNNPIGGDGYETLVFNQGKGNLLDGAWVRISPNDPKTVQIAFKLSMLGNPSSFAMGAWAGANIDPSIFDYNDHMTHAQAGDPNQGYPQVYPIKALAEIDNTCRLAIGFVPTTKIPGLCTIPTPAVPAGGAPPCHPILGAMNNCP